MVLLWPLASSPRPGPLLALPAGSRQLKVGKATPAAELTWSTVHSDGALQTALPALAVSQTKRTTLPAGGVMLSVMRTPVP